MDKHIRKELLKVTQGKEHLLECDFIGHIEERDWWTRVRRKTRHGPRKGAPNIMSYAERFALQR